MSKQYRCILEHTRTKDGKSYTFKINKVYKVEMSQVSNFHTIYHGNKQFPVSSLFLKNKFIDEDIVQKALRRDKKIDEILEND